MTRSTKRTVKRREGMEEQEVSDEKEEKENEMK
jgi:hypothetical protein